MNVKKEDILDALGIETNDNWMMFALAGFGVGCLVGAGIALAFAPKSGRELRSDLYERGRDLMGKAQEFGREARSEYGQVPPSGIPPTTPTY